MKVRKLIDSFNYAIDGIFYSIKTQRNMKIHMIMAILVIVGSMFFDLTKWDLALVLFSIFLVIITEMINTSIEVTIDLITREYHPLAKIAKNVAAGGVLLAALNSVLVAYIVFYDKFIPIAEILFNKIRKTSLHISFLSFLIVIISVIIIKLQKGIGTPLKGGMPSGHTAVAFSILTSIIFISSNIYVIILGLILALLVGQSRIEGKIHTWFQVFIGGILGVGITLLFFYFLGNGSFPPL
ncbi:MAG: diacylglycerol kinase [Anaeromicrobium sp.]|jgi:diacylglycerol kinase (ATP)|uniref:diacylglycerol kinase n=1 Tax=Anaeromicrobium sp. TaxID=1929132 RepID=UPI0025F28AE4|nr:diacylglycerol kinase [Anaeromicrobium sp.]MCT4594589.1 diacylglycerol kinase [Anaeromicrobium sp.]